MRGGERSREEREERREERGEETRGEERRGEERRGEERGERREERGEEREEREQREDRTERREKRESRREDRTERRERREDDPGLKFPDWCRAWGVVILAMYVSRVCARVSGSYQVLRSLSLPFMNTPTKPAEAREPAMVIIVNSAFIFPRDSIGSRKEYSWVAALNPNHPRKKRVLFLHKYKECHTPKV